ncbi:ArsR/SmtB family transcription factor [Xanthomonas campestris]|uniref:ArsR/SmtB family transcription factor n=1 Tax=Xanthomonas campestris TaxID=339 RepID=UPI003CCFF1F2
MIPLLQPSLLSRTPTDSPHSECLFAPAPTACRQGEIAERLSIPPTRMSFHLATLERARLLRSWRDGRRVLYAASYEDMRQLLAFLTEDCCSGNPEICGVALTPCASETCA